MQTRISNHRTMYPQNLKLECFWRFCQNIWGLAGIYVFLGIASLLAIKKKYFYLTASHCFHVYVYSCFLKAWYKSRLIVLIYATTTVLYYFRYFIKTTSIWSNETYVYLYASVTWIFCTGKRDCIRNSMLKGAFTRISIRSL